MNTAPERRENLIPREVPHSCSECGGQAPVLNGLYFRNLRIRAKLTLKEMSRISKVSIGYLSRMEVGDAPFVPRLAGLYEQLFERRRKAGDWLEEDDEKA